jgi:hypothetical protein
MKKLLFALFITACLANTAIAQAPKALKKVLELKMPKTAEDDMPGTRGASVVWHPLQKKYYASFAGNQAYPMAVFNATGKRLSADDATTQADTRGLWYNPVKKQVCGNGYNETGWFSYSLNPVGLVKNINFDKEGLLQPGEQSVGTYNISKKQVLFLKGSQIWAYDTSATPLESKTILHWGLTAKDGIAEDENVEETPEGYNNTSIIYTALPNAEIGVLNIVDKQIELYSIKTGFLAKKLQLPEDATAEASFNFAFANGIYWLFNMEKRTWVGYQ